MSKPIQHRRRILPPASLKIVEDKVIKSCPWQRKLQASITYRLRRLATYFSSSSYYWFGAVLLTLRYFPSTQTNGISYSCRKYLFTIFENVTVRHSTWQLYLPESSVPVCEMENIMAVTQKSKLIRCPNARSQGMSILQSSMARPRGERKLAYNLMNANKSIHVVITMLMVRITGSRVWGLMKLDLMPGGGSWIGLSYRGTWESIRLIAVQHRLRSSN